MNLLSASMTNTIPRLGRRGGINRKPMVAEPPLLQLPFDAFKLITDYLDDESIESLYRVCRKTRRYVANEHIINDATIEFLEPNVKPKRCYIASCLGGDVCHRCHIDQFAYRKKPYNIKHLMAIRTAADIPTSLPVLMAPFNLNWNDVEDLHLRLEAPITFEELKLLLPSNPLFIMARIRAINTTLAEFTQFLNLLSNARCYM